MRRCQLLVSVRSAEESAAALAGGADVIDVKEPSRGALGASDEEVISSVINHVAGRRPVSAAMGELIDWPFDCENGSAFRREIFSSLAFLKWGLARCRADINWRQRLLQLRESFGAKVVSVAYADFANANAPAIDAVVEFATQQSEGVLLIDTCTKTPGQNLLRFLSIADLSRIRAKCHDTGVQLALAGSLGPEQIEELRRLQPDWFAVRGAVCVAGRQTAIDSEKVRELCEISGLGNPVKK